MNKILTLRLIFRGIFIVLNEFKDNVKSISIKSHNLIKNVKILMMYKLFVFLYRKTLLVQIHQSIFTNVHTNLNSFLSVEISQ